MAEHGRKFAFGAHPGGLGVTLRLACRGFFPVGPSVPCGPERQAVLVGVLAQRRLDKYTCQASFPKSPTLKNGAVTRWLMMMKGRSLF
jgi:hypothetical protein